MSDAPVSPPSGMPVAVRTWGSVIVSVAILVAFAGGVVVVLFRAIPDGSDAIANVMLGTLAALATQVANYWLGSSAGSAAKDAKR